MSELAKASYQNSLNAFLNDERVAALDPNKFGIAVNAFNSEFKKSNSELFNSGDLNDDIVKEISGRSLSDYKTAMGVGRWFPKNEEFDIYYEPLPQISDKDTTEQKILKFEDWKSKSAAKALPLRPADKEDIETHLDYLTNEFIRQNIGGDTGYVADKMYRLGEGAASLVSPIIPGADAFFARNLPENPEMDKDTASLFASGLGQAVTQLGTFAAISAVAGPAAASSSIAGIYSLNAFAEGYKQEMLKSGDEGKAVDVGLAGVPGALVESLADTFVFGLLSSQKTAFKTALAAAKGADEVKAVIKQFIPSVSENAAKGFISEATIGSIGADFTTGYGRFLASGDESYIPKGEDLLKGAFVEGSIGALIGGGMTGLQKRGAFGQMASDFVNFSVPTDRKVSKADLDARYKEIYTSLKSGNYEKVMEIASKPYANIPEKTKEAETLVSKTKEEIEASKNSIIAGSAQVAHLKQRLKQEQEAGNKEVADKIASALEAISNGSFVKSTEFDVDASKLTEEGFEVTPDPVGDTQNSFNIKLDNGNEIVSGDRTFYVSGVNVDSLNAHQIADGGVGLLLNGEDSRIVVGKSLLKGRNKIKFSQFPKKGYTAVTANEVYRNENGDTVVSKFKIEGTVVDRKKSEKVNQEQDIVVQKAKQALVRDNTNKALESAVSALEDIRNNRDFSEAGLKAVEQKVESAINTLADSTKFQKQEDIDVINEMADQLIFELDNLRNTKQESIPVLMNRGNVASVKSVFNKQEEQNRQERFNSPVVISDVVGKEASFQGEKGIIGIDNGVVVLLRDNNDFVEISNNPNAEISSIEGLYFGEASLVTSKENATQKEQEVNLPEFTLGPDANGLMYKREVRSDGVYKVNQDGTEEKILGKKGGRVVKNITKDPEVVLETTQQNAITSVEKKSSASSQSSELNMVTISNLDDLITQGGGTVIVQQGGRQVKFKQFGITIDGNTAEVAYVDLDPSERGSGIGLSAYEALGRSLANKGITLQSSKAQFSLGRRVWEKLAARGLAKKGAQGVYLFTNTPTSTSTELLTKQSEKFVNNTLVQEIKTEEPVVSEQQADNSRLNYLKEELSKPVEERWSKKTDEQIELEIAQLNPSSPVIVVSKKTKAKKENTVEEAPKEQQVDKKEGINKGDLIADDIETNIDKTNGIYIFKAKEKNYSVSYVRSGDLKGWHLIDTVENKLTLIGKTKEEAKRNLATLVNKNSDISRFEVEIETPSSQPIENPDKVNENRSADIVIYGNQILESPDLEKLLPSLKDTAKNRTNVKNANKYHNKFKDLFGGYGISPSEFLEFYANKDSIKEEASTETKAIDDYISTIENEKAKEKWNTNKEKIVKYLGFVINNPSSERPQEFLDLGNVILNRVDDIAKSLDSNVSKGLETAVEQEARMLKARIRNQARADSLAKAQREKQEKSGQDKISYSLSENSTSQGMSEKDVIDFVGDKASVISTRQPTPSGKQWSGMTVFSENGPRIYINASNIRDVNHLRKVLNEELAHIAFNDAELSSFISKISSSTEIRDGLGGYAKEDLFEESVTKRIADLVDQYTEKGFFNKVLTAIKSIVKDKLGMELNDSDLSYIAYRAIQKASKVTNNSLNKKTKYSLFEEFDDLDSRIKGTVSESKKDIVKTLNNLIKKKLEKKLIIAEPSVYRAFKSINFSYLSDADIAEYKTLLEEFVNTRSKTKEPSSDVRTSSEVVLEKLSNLTKKSNQAYFDTMQLEHEFLQDKDFQKDFEGGDIKLLRQAIKDNISMNDGDTPSISKGNEAIDNIRMSILNLQSLAIENQDFVRDRENEMFPGNVETNNPIIAENLKSFTESTSAVLNRYREVFREYVDSLMVDPTTIDSYKDLRNQYYGLMDFFGDGYAYNIQDFVTKETQQLLETELSEKDFNDLNNLHPWLKGASSFATNIRSLGDKVYEVFHKLTVPFREGIMEAEKIHESFTRKTLKSLMQKAIEEHGKKFNDVELNFAGIYAKVRSYKLSESAKDGIRISRRAIEESLKKDIDSKKSGRDKSAREKMDFLNNLFAGIDPDNYPDNTAEILESNAARIMPKPLIEYVWGINEMFEVTKPLAKFSAEFSFGMPFEEWVNYTPWFSVEREGIQATANTDISDLNQTSEDKALPFDKRANLPGGNMGSLEAKTRRLGEGRVYIYNINYLAENRMRLNILDYLTASQRRELNNVVSGKGTKHRQLVKMLNDEGGKTERTALFSYAVRNMWNNAVQSASFVAPMQGMVNSISNIWASTKLASVYQFPAQLISNITPYFVVNFTNPKKIGYLFDAYNIMLKKQFGGTIDPRLDKVYNRVKELIESRSQEQYLDKSISLSLNSNDLWQKIKSSELYSHIEDINGIREKILFSPFKASDYASGIPMMMAEIMHLEEQAGRAVDWNGLTINADTFIKALDNTERFIGIGASTRRSKFTDNKNGYISILKNMLSAFSSHRINNATNFRVELSKLTNGGLSPQEKVQSIQYMLGIAAQSASFTFVKWGILTSMYNIMMDFLGDDENEKELDAKYAKLLGGRHSETDKKILQTEIAMRNKIRSEYQKIKNKNSSTYLLSTSFGRDLIGNSFLIPSVVDFPVNGVIHAFLDEHEANSFKAHKDAKLKELGFKLKRAKDAGVRQLEISLTKEIARLEAQEAIAAAPEFMSGTGIGGGLYGGVTEDAYRLLKAAGKATVNVETPSLAEVFGGLGLIGLNQPDLNRLVRMISKQQEYEKEAKEKIQEIKAKR